MRQRLSSRYRSLCASLLEAHVRRRRPVRDDRCKNSAGYAEGEVRTHQSARQCVTNFHTLWPARSRRAVASPNQNR